jgi:hypothetical protein
VVNETKSIGQLALIINVFKLPFDPNTPDPENSPNRREVLILTKFDAVPIPFCAVTMKSAVNKGGKIVGFQSVPGLSTEEAVTYTTGKPLPFRPSSWLHPAKPRS